MLFHVMHAVVIHSALGSMVYWLSVWLQSCALLER